MFIQPNQLDECFKYISITATKGQGFCFFNCTKIESPISFLLTINHCSKLCCKCWLHFFHVRQIKVNVKIGLFGKSLLFQLCLSTSAWELSPFVSWTHQITQHVPMDPVQIQRDACFVLWYYIWGKREKKSRESRCSFAKLHPNLVLLQ